jgi:hypothetical protein
MHVAGYNFIWDQNGRKKSLRTKTLLGLEHWGPNRLISKLKKKTEEIEKGI